MKKFSLNILWTVAKTVEVEANNEEEALNKIWSTINKGDVCVWTDGFEATDDVQVECIREEDENGQLKYH